MVTVYQCLPRRCLLLCPVVHYEYMYSVFVVRVVLRSSHAIVGRGDMRGVVVVS